MKTLIALAVLALAALLMWLAVPAGAQTQAMCFSRDFLASTLTGVKYNEKIMLSGSAGKDATMLLYANPLTGTWTIVVETPSRSCMVGAGRNMVVAKPEIPGVKS